MTGWCSRRTIRRVVDRVELLSARRPAGEHFRDAGRMFESVERSPFFTYTPCMGNRGWGFAVVVFATGVGCTDTSGPAECASAGGRCVVGGSSCSTVGSQDCNPNRNPGGAFCCLDQSPSECTDANVQLIRASDYNQSCNADSDCVAVPEGNACYPCVIACTSAAIRITAKAQYSKDVARTTGARAGATTCFCPREWEPCCVAGKCHADVECSTEDR